jgi:hypothetical protein
MIDGGVGCRNRTAPEYSEMISLATAMFRHQRREGVEVGADSREEPITSSSYSQMVLYMCSTVHVSLGAAGPVRPITA